jgi:hypothetical protein
MWFCCDGKEVLEETAGGRDRVFRHGVVAAGAESPDLVALELGEPEAPIGSQRDVMWPAAGGRDRVLGDRAGSADAAAAKRGWAGTAIVAFTRLVASLITDTVFANSLTM